MNLDELKMVWLDYDRRLQSTQLINEKIIISMITERTSSRFLKVKRQYILGFTWMFICLCAGVLILASNPFDYQMPLQYVPIGIYTACIIILIIGMILAYNKLQKISIHHNTIDTALRKIISVYEKPKKFFTYTVIVFLFCQVVLFPLSFLPHHIGTMGLWTALGERLIPIAISALLLLVAYHFGAFKERHAAKFKEDLNELEELKTMSNELKREA
jgi:hypothetical protein